MKQIPLHHKEPSVGIAHCHPIFLFTTYLDLPSYLPWGMLFNGSFVQVKMKCIGDLNYFQLDIPITCFVQWRFEVLEVRFLDSCCLFWWNFTLGCETHRLFQWWSNCVVFSQCHCKAKKDYSYPSVWIGGNSLPGKWGIFEIAVCYFLSLLSDCSTLLFSFIKFNSPLTCINPNKPLNCFDGEETREGKWKLGENYFPLVWILRKLEEK